MIHEIAPEVMDNQYKVCEPDDSSNICIIENGSVWLYLEGNTISWPKYKELKEKILEKTYLFSISGVSYFSAKMAEIPEDLKLEKRHWSTLRDALPVYEAFACMTAIHLKSWYDSVTYCGKCGAKAVHDEKERMMRCPSCGNMMFPKISPAIIAAVRDTEKNKVLLTKYRGRDNYALVAGFVEIGETLEECVAREVMEETGVKIKNIRYFGSQPWGYVGNVMIGYTAELDGESKIRVDENELAVAEWLAPEEIPEVPELSSLTRTMIDKFKKGILF